eukprot:1149518-Pelagomonas_calceolata.AAC.7
MGGRVEQMGQQRVGQVKRGVVQQSAEKGARATKWPGRSLAATARGGGSGARRGTTAAGPAWRGVWWAAAGAWLAAARQAGPGEGTRAAWPGPTMP